MSKLVCRWMGLESEGIEVVNWIGFEPGENVSVRLCSDLLNPRSQGRIWDSLLDRVPI